MRMKSYAAIALPPPQATLACRSISAMTARRLSWRCDGAGNLIGIRSHLEKG